ncbi:hypothetical protein BGZ49_008536 [Haplosporangium sp. Z 27]|nr:hypothetical protein BGZ49_008536 [Haplosporangium sp. Z 27]
MLTACADLTRATISPSHHQHRDQTNNAPSQISAHKKRKFKSVPLESRSNDFKSNFLQTILESIEFTSNDVFKIACSIYYGIPAGSYPGNERQHTITHIKPSLEVTNAFLHVCAISGHFDQAWLILEDMMDRKQGDIKPNLTTYRHVLKAASVQRQKLSDQSLDVADIDVKTEKILDYASSSLSKQSQVALWMKLGLGGLVGATVGKFTMMGIMALPSSSILNGLSEPKEGEGSMIIDSYQSGEGIIHFLATQEVALGIGLITGLLTTGYYIRLSTLSSRADPAQEQVIRSRNQYFREDLPRARLFGLSFPDLKTTNKDEIREYLRKNADF